MVSDGKSGREVKRAETRENLGGKLNSVADVPVKFSFEDRFGVKEQMRTKVDERREREEYDRANPWRPMTEPVPEGIACELLFNDMETSRDRRYFLHEDGRWYRIDKPEQVNRAIGWYGGRVPMNWRPTNAKLSPTRRYALVHLATRDYS